MQPLVSVITPCYNGERKIRKFLDSVLNQTYKNIEFIIINDGSTDNTEQIILSYKEKFKEQGYKFVYLKQSNKGQDVAINKGLKYFSGDYLMWPDSDDILLPTNIEAKVNHMEKNKNIGLVYCNVNLVKESNLNDVISKWNKILYKGRLKNFDDILLGKVILAGGAWMIRSKYFLKINPKKEIIITGQGQNLQMLLPIAFNYDMGKVDEFLFTYIIYEDSHSNKKRSYSDSKKRINDSIDGISKMLKTTGMDNILYNKYLKLVQNQWNIIKLNTAINYYNKEDSKKIYLALKKNNIKIDMKTRIKYYLNKFNLYRLYKKTRK